MHSDLASLALSCWLLLYAVLRNPEPTPEEWWWVYRYAVFVLMVRVGFESGLFCMDVASTDPKSADRWKVGMRNRLL